MPRITCQQIQAQFPGLIPSTKGPLDAPVEGFGTLENASAQQMIFVLNDKYIDQALKSPARLVLAPLSAEKKLQQIPSGQSWLFTANPELAMAKIKTHFFQTTPYRSENTRGRHSTAVIDPAAEIAKDATIGPGAVIGPRVKIGARCFVGANSVIEAGVEIDEDTVIHPLVYIGHSCVIGKRCEVLPNTCIGSEGYGYAHDEKWNHYRIPHTGRVVLHDDVHVGANCSIDRGTIEDSIIGQGTRIDNQVHLAHNSIIGKNGLITAQFGMAGSSTIGNNFVTGGKTSVTGHIKITDNVQVGGMSGVTKDITEPGQYGGFPLQKLQDYLKTKAAMAQLHEMRKQLKKLTGERS